MRCSCYLLMMINYKNCWRLTLTKWTASSRKLCSSLRSLPVSFLHSCAVCKCITTRLAVMFVCIVTAFVWFNYSSNFVAFYCASPHKDDHSALEICVGRQVCFLTCSSSAKNFPTRTHPIFQLFTFSHSSHTIISLSRTNHSQSIHFRTVLFHNNMLAFQHDKQWSSYCCYSCL